MSTDSHAGMLGTLSSPCSHAEAVTPSDTVDLTITSRALFIGGAGALAVITALGETVTFTGVVAGTVLPLRVSRVKSTGTTATNIVGMA